MKNLVKMMMVLTALFVLGVGQVWAYPISENQSIYLNKMDDTGGGYNVGGVFYGGGDFGVSTVKNGEVLFSTFCLELGVFMDFNTPYKVSSIVDYVAVEDAPNRVIGNGTKYLFWHFSQGTLGGDGVNFDPVSQNDVRALQLAIWSLEGYTEGTGPENIKQGWLTGIEEKYAALVELGSSGIYDESQMNVKVMNLMSGNTYIQSQLIAGPTPVPEPGTLLLLGSGLAGLALYRRRTRK